MKNKLLIILFLLQPFFVFSQTTGKQDTSSLSAMNDKLLDYHMLRDVFEVRRLSDIDQRSIKSDVGNRSLGEFCAYFYQTQKIDIKIKSIIETDRFLENLNVRKYRSIKDEEATFYLEIDVVLTNPRYIPNQGNEYDLTIDFTPSYTLEQSQKIPQARYEAAKAFLNDRIGKKIIGPTKDRLNSAVIGALMILAGAMDYPVTATLTPKNVADTNRMQNLVFQDQYRSLSINNKQVYIPWYSLEAGKTLEANIRLHRMLADTIDKPIKISTSNGMTQTMSSADSSKHFSLGTFPEGEYSVNVNMESNNFQVPLASMDVAVYKKKDFKLKLVPVGNVNVDKNDYETILNTIYAGVIIGWEVEILPNFTPANFSGKVGVGENSLFSNYSDDMNKIIKEYKSQADKIDKDAFYVFIVPAFSQGIVFGYMPMNRNFGFVSVQTGKPIEYTVKTLAHELGHGAFCLQHIDKEYGIDSYRNLMMSVESGLYSPLESAKLYKYQWDQAHNPPSELYLFQDDDFLEKIPAEKKMNE